MKINYQNKHVRTILYLLSFFFPFAIFAGYFAMHGMRILTVDLGQQYIDLLAFYKDHFFNPAAYSYSFANGLGGSLIGTFFYYLASPFNMLLLFFSKSQLPIAIYWIISLKVGTIGLTSYYYFQKHYQKIYALAGSSAFALSGYVIAYNLNLMWLDSLILLPLLILQIHQVGKKNWLILVTFLLWVTDFYTGYMALVFGFFYFAIYLFNHPTNWQKKLLNYVIKSTTATLLAAFALIPTIYEIINNKNSSAVFNWGIQFTPYKLLGKFISGSYNFHEMQAGLPNVYLTILFFLISLTYFLSQKFSLKERLSYAVLLLFLFVSCWFNPLVLFWHLGQFPTWYPARFSFVISFLLIELALKVLSRQPNISIRQLILIVLISAGLFTWLLTKNRFDFLDHNKVLISLVFAVIAIIIAAALPLKNILVQGLILGLTIIATALNLNSSLNSISYQANEDYSNFTENVASATNSIKNQDSSLYRLEKTFSRSDDDPFSDGYYGLSVFNSIANSKINSFISYQGLAHNSNAFINKFSTQVLDSLLGVKYTLQPYYGDDNVKNSQRMKYNNRLYRTDINSMTFGGDFKQLSYAINQTALPLAYISQRNWATNYFENQPIKNQQSFYTAATGDKTTLFTTINLPTAQLENAKASGNSTYQKKVLTQAATISFAFTPKTNNSYYLQLPANLTGKIVSFTINGESVDIDARYDQVKLLNIANKQKGKKIVLSFTLLKNKVNLANIIIWELNSKHLTTTLTKLKKNQPIVKETKAGTIETSTFTTSGNQTLRTSIPYDNNWTIYDNGKKINYTKFTNTFLEIQLVDGKHKIKFVYVPHQFYLGLLLSVITGICLLAYYFYHKRNQ
ncbi:YfhO family protein [Lactobacillus mulieris]|uniref:YfhO family protein n=1 Tax=Lactobacillus mulieris TaxID=2508708 RepID=A0AAW5WZ12_9LACO|nr:YfhO family protein [Lactobacillus mulieris]MCZ3622663.1 YfhO family protein [Lactobacillus mulieris]MCZ3624301.1 YfhO family protein [Lactobacillus mulieris]MCZ3636670.1 YfhO family protein [Lactobacillus mulieris]MCZ3690402.1 YfhO family protein [Lactobacillus mulieris]MCZ3696342.1 YfhO family protein [Lactobacillus mulieris]